MPKQTFESAMKKLEQIVGEMESGDLSLERAIKRFEDGVELSKFCTRTLDETEARIGILLEDKDGNPSEEPFQAVVEPQDGVI